MTHNLQTINKIPKGVSPKTHGKALFSKLQYINNLQVTKHILPADKGGRRSIIQNSNDISAYTLYSFGLKGIRSKSICIDSCITLNSSDIACGEYASHTLTGRQAPPLANTPASGSQQATQLSPRAAPPAECHDRKINIGS